MSTPPRCIVIAGPNGAGKTTFAREFLARDEGIIHFVNADVIASGLSPFDPQRVALAAGRIFLAELDRLARARESFAFESTLSGMGHLVRLRRLKAEGYWIEIVFLRLDAPSLALRRVAGRVRQGGHAVPHSDILRRYERAWENFDQRYRLEADAWTVYDNSGEAPILFKKEFMKTPKLKSRSDELTAAVGRALRRSAKVARKTARMHGTPIYISRNGKIVAEKA